MENELSYKPSAYYYREALRTAPTKKVAIEFGQLLIEEIERHKQWIREHGLVPPKWLIMQTERNQKNWAEVIPFATEALHSSPPSDCASASAKTSE